MNIDLIKEKIAWYKLLFTVLVTLAVGTVGWFSANYSKAIHFFVVIDTIFITSFLLGIIFCFAKVYCLKIKFRIFLEFYKGSMRSRSAGFKENPALPVFRKPNSF